jgi:hypothetical protein
MICRAQGGARGTARGGPRGDVQTGGRRWDAHPLRGWGSRLVAEPRAKGTAPAPAEAGGTG